MVAIRQRTICPDRDIRNRALTGKSIGFETMVSIESAGISDVGRKRSGNEDSFFLDDNMRLYVVADGMGGHQAGEVASALVVETVRDYMKRFNSDEDAQELEDPDETLSKYANRLLSGIYLANRGVYGVAQTDDTYRGMGSTVSAAYFIDDALIVANVGDSPIYLVHDGNIELLSVIHNVMAEQKAIDPEAAAELGEAFRHMLTRAIGIEENVEADICETPYFVGDRIIMSSDGLTDKVSPEEILEIVSSRPPEKACRQLVDMANERGGDDNITVIVLNIENARQEKHGFVGLISRIAAKLFSKLFS